MYAYCYLLHLLHFRGRGWARLQAGEEETNHPHEKAQRGRSSSLRLSDEDLCGQRMEPGEEARGQAWAAPRT